jgi:hypothetical protein
MPALLIDRFGRNASVGNREDLDAMTLDGQAERVESRIVLLRWNNGQTEKRTLRTVQLKNRSNQLRDISARMSPPDPSRSGKISTSSPYHNLLDALASGTRKEFGQRARAIIEAWKTPRT